MFTVPDAFAGRRAVCKACGGAVNVPALTATPGHIAPLAKPPLRVRRLQADAAQLAVVFRDFPPIKVCKSTGDPPDVYEVAYHVRGLERGKKDKPVWREEHRVEIRLTSDYPRLAPHCRMLTPIFHPNIDPTTICVGDHWTAGERLANLIVRIGEMIAYQAYNIKSPLDAEAAMWADLHTAELPVDSRNLRPAEL
ncbi:MAG TPA: ubiquitin-conjugating enzyme E2 [Tepidisphaeraceae bacterium]|nr:ubiquitin-conjugating enzyme E2 [Tepidisphaeraceae bacterium]